MGNTFASLFFSFFFSISFQLSFFNYFIQLKEYRMKMIILIGLLLSVITVESKSIQRKRAAGNAEKRARQMDQGPASFKADENEESMSREENKDNFQENNGADTELDHHLTAAKRQRLIRSIIGWGLNELRDTEEQGKDEPGCLKWMKYCKKTTRYGEVQKIGTCCGGYKCGIAGYCESA